MTAVAENTETTAHEGATGRVAVGEEASALQVGVEVQPPPEQHETTVCAVEHRYFAHVGSVQAPGRRLWRALGRL